MYSGIEAVRATGMLRLLAAAALVAAGAARAGTLDVRIVDGKGAPVADAVVVAVPNAGLPPLPARPRVEIVDQVDKEFVPRVKPVLRGSLVQFPNKDNIRHQVYSFSPAKQFELPLYAGTPASPVVFDKPGVVTLGCNIHDWMVGYVYVSESPYFAKTGADGKATIANLPEGTYLVRAWHPLMTATESQTVQSLTVGGDGHAAADWSLALKPEIRIPRAPDADAGGPY